MNPEPVLYILCIVSHEWSHECDIQGLETVTTVWRETQHYDRFFASHVDELEVLSVCLMAV